MFRRAVRNWIIKDQLSFVGIKVLLVARERWGNFGEISMVLPRQYKIVRLGNVYADNSNGDVTRTSPLLPTKFLIGDFWFRKVLFW